MNYLAAYYATLKSSVAPTASGAALVLADMATSVNLALTGDTFGGAVTGSVWSGVSKKTLPASTAGWMQFTVIATNVENGELIADGDTATPNGDGDYGNDYAIKNSYGSLRVVAGSTGTAYAGLLMAGDVARMSFLADNTFSVAVSRDGGLTFGAPVASGTRSGPLTLKIAGASGKSLKNVTYAGFA